MNQYPIGNLVGVVAHFSISGVAINPTTVWVDVQKNNATRTQFLYGVNPEVTMLATGTFYMNVFADVKGLYYYVWYSSGTGQAAQQGSFQVTDTIAS
jgi:hypothetical protein